MPFRIIAYEHSKVRCKYDAKRDGTTAETDTHWSGTAAIILKSVYLPGVEWASVRISGETINQVLEEIAAMPKFAGLFNPETLPGILAARETRYVWQREEHKRNMELARENLRKTE